MRHNVDFCENNGAHGIAQDAQQAAAWDQYSLNDMLRISAGAQTMTAVFLRVFEELLQTLADVTCTSRLRTGRLLKLGCLP